MALLDAQAGMGRMALAAWTYHKKHGKLLETMELLVPDFLSELPVDPFTGKPFEYRDGTLTCRSGEGEFGHEDAKFRLQ